MIGVCIDLAVLGYMTLFGYPKSGPYLAPRWGVPGSGPEHLYTVQAAIQGVDSIAPHITCSELTQNGTRNGTEMDPKMDTIWVHIGSSDLGSFLDHISTHLETGKLGDLRP